MRRLSFSGLLFMAMGFAEAKDWVELFNGNNLDGWVVKIAGHELGDKYANAFRVKDGVIAEALALPAGDGVSIWGGADKGWAFLCAAQ